MAGLPSLELVCFGPPAARLDGRDPAPEVLWRKHLALLIHLALSPNRARARDHLLGLLWPEKEESQARHSLNEAVRRLRRCLGDERLQSRGEAIELAEAGLEVDALRFMEMAERDPARAAALVKGDFLEGFTLDDAPGFEDWASAERDRFRSRAAGALVALGERELAFSRFADAGDAGRRAMAILSYSEPAVRLVMRAAALAGDPSGALAAYRDFAAHLGEAIGEKPGRELLSLSERIRQRTWRPARAAQREPDPPLLGRTEIYRDAFAAVTDGLERGPRTLVITGEPGMGRSRLLAECADRLALEGAFVVSARPLATDHDARWSTLRQLMRTGLAAAPGLVGAAPEALSALAGVAPELAQRFPPREPHDAAQVAAALAQVTTAVAEEQPLALIVDDAHLADGATLTALAAAIEAVRNVPVVLAVSALALPEGAPPELLHLRGTVGRTLPGAALKLEPLGPADLLALVSALATWCRDSEQRDRLARRLTQETAGNPFFAVTLLRGLDRMATLRDDFVAWPRPQATFESPLPFTLPELVRTAIAVRIAELDDRTRQVMSAASLAGQALDLDLVAGLVEVPRAQVEERLAPAERCHLVRFHDDRYAFIAPVIADVVRAECLTPGQRQRLSRRAIELLASRQEPESRLLRAELLARMEPGPAAFDEAIALAHAAQTTAGARTAQRALAAAERAAGKTPTPEQQRLLEELRQEVRR